MLKRHTVWLWTAAVFLFLTAALHSISFVISPTGKTEAERQMLALMINNKMDMGAGFHPTMWNLFTALSACFSLLFLLAGLTLAFLLKKKAAAAGVLKGVVTIQLLVIGTSFIINLFLTFPVPILVSGLCVLFLAIGLLMTPRVNAS